MRSYEIACTKMQSRNVSIQISKLTNLNIAHGAPVAKRADYLAAIQ